MNERPSLSLVTQGSTRVVTIQALNITARLALTDNQEIGTIRCFLNKHGDRTQFEEQGVIAVIEWEHGGWSCVMTNDFENILLC